MFHVKHSTRPRERSRRGDSDTYSGDPTLDSPFLGFDNYTPHKIEGVVGNNELPQCPTGADVGPLRQIWV